MDSPYFHNLAAVRRQQVLFAMDLAATQWIISLFELKTQFQNDNLTFLQNRRPHLAKNIAQTIQKTAKWLDAFKPIQTGLLETVRMQIMGVEGNLAREYWNLIEMGFENPTLFEGRNRRPATDTFNAALNYAYGMLYNIVEQACFAAGLDPQLGFLHVDDYAKPTLVFDMIEPFRVWIDRMLLEAFLKRDFQALYFEPTADFETTKGIQLSKEGKHWLIPMVNNWMADKIRFREKQLSRKNHLFRFTGEFVQQLKAFQFKR
jgi:CRISPR-associated protein Cas1